MTDASIHSLQEALHDAVADEPPLRLDLDALTTTGRRRQARRRTMLGASVATVLVAVAATGLPWAQPLLSRNTPPVEGEHLAWPDTPYSPLTSAESEEVAVSLASVTENAFASLDGVMVVGDMVGEVGTGGEQEQEWSVAFAMTDMYGDAYQTRVTLTAVTSPLPDLNCERPFDAADCRGPWSHESYPGVKTMWLEEYRTFANHSYRVRLNKYQAIEIHLDGDEAADPTGDQVFSVVELAAENMLDEIEPQSWYLQVFDEN